MTRDINIVASPGWNGVRVWEGFFRPLLEVTWPHIFVPARLGCQSCYSVEWPGWCPWLPYGPVLGGESILCRAEMASRALISSVSRVRFGPCIWATTGTDKVGTLNSKRRAWIPIKVVSCACVIIQIQIGNWALEERTTKKIIWLEWIWILRRDGASIP